MKFRPGPLGSLLLFLTALSMLPSALIGLLTAVLFIVFVAARLLPLLSL